MTIERFENIAGCRKIGAIRAIHFFGGFAPYKTMFFRSL